METLIIVIAFWLILLGMYGAISYYRERTLDRRATSRWIAGGRHFDTETESVAVAPRPFFAATVDYGQALASRPQVDVSMDGFFSEVDELRAQVAHLRSEIFALAVATPDRIERPRLVRYQTGTYTYLPRILRRHVRQVRSFRRSPLRAAM